MFHSLCYQSMGILRCPINWEWNSPIKAGRLLPYMEFSRYIKPIYAKPANVNKTSNQNPLIKTKSNPSI